MKSNDHTGDKTGRHCEVRHSRPVVLRDGHNQGRHSGSRTTGSADHLSQCHGQASCRSLPKGQKESVTFLTTQELRRLIAKSGGLWSAADLTRITGGKARDWTHRDGFPDAAWETGRVRLYAGWEVWDWLRASEKWSAAEYLESELRSIERRKFAKA